MLSGPHRRTQDGPVNSRRSAFGKRYCREEFKRGKGSTEGEGLRGEGEMGTPRARGSGS